MTLEARYENKTCSACREWLIETLKECESVRVLECESVKVREWFLSIDMKTKVVQHVKSEWMREWKSERVREWDICSACPKDQHMYLTWHAQCDIWHNYKYHTHFLVHCQWTMVDVTTSEEEGGVNILFWTSLQKHTNGNWPQFFKGLFELNQMAIWP